MEIAWFPPFWLRTCPRPFRCRWCARGLRFAHPLTYNFSDRHLLLRTSTATHCFQRSSLVCAAHKLAASCVCVAGAGQRSHQSPSPTQRGHCPRGCFCYSAKSRISPTLKRKLRFVLCNNSVTCLR